MFYQSSGKKDLSFKLILWQSWKTFYFIWARWLIYCVIVFWRKKRLIYWCHLTSRTRRIIKCQKTLLSIVYEQKKNSINTFNNHLTFFCKIMKGCETQTQRKIGSFKLNWTWGRYSWNHVPTSALSIQNSYHFGSTRSVWKILFKCSCGHVLIFFGYLRF
jgi:hypothetical protein